MATTLHQLTEHFGELHGHNGGGWPVGLPMSEEHKQKIKKALLGKKKSPQHCINNGLAKKGQAPWNKGLKGVQISTRKGIPQPQFRGENHWNWRGGESKKERQILMNQVEYKLWRKAVFERDRWTCVECNYRSKGKTDINADHIKPWSLYPKLRYAIDNGRTLCVPCHQKTFIFIGNQYMKGVN